MGITLGQVKALTTDKVYSEVISNAMEDTLLGRMVFDNCVSSTGGSLTYSYVRTLTRGSVGFRPLNGAYTPDETTVDRVSTDLKIFGGSFEIDRVIAKTANGIVNHVKMQLDNKTKSLKTSFSDSFINGDIGMDVNSFDGIDKVVTGSVTHRNAVAIDLSDMATIKEQSKLFLRELDLMIADMAKTPDMLLMNKKMFAMMKTVARETNLISINADEFGKPIIKYAGIELVELGDKETTTGVKPIISIQDGRTCIYAVCIGLDDVHGVTPTGDSLIEVYLPKFDNAGEVQKGGVEMVSAIVVKNSRSVGKLDNIKIQ